MLTLLLIISTAGCSFIGSWEVNIPMSFDTYQEAWYWVATNIEYDYDAPQYWPHPETVYSISMADCRGYSILLAWFLYDMGYDPIITVYDPYWGEVLHAVVYVEGIGYLEPQIYGLYDSVYNVKRTYTFHQIMDIARR